MFDKIRAHFGKKADAAEAPSFQQKINPMKEMLTDYAEMIGKEIASNRELDNHQDFDVIVRDPGKDGGAQLQGMDVMHLKAINKDDLAAMLEKINKWNQDDSSEELPLKPREIEAMQQIVNAIEEKELVIKQGDKLFAVDKTEVYNAIKDKHATIEKAENLAKQKFIGVGKDGQLGAFDNAEDAEGIYNILDENVDLEEAFGGKDQPIFDEAEFIQEAFGISDEDLGRMRRVSYTEDFKQESDVLTKKYENLSANLQNLYDKSVQKLDLNSNKGAKGIKQKKSEGKSKLTPSGKPINKETVDFVKEDMLRSTAHHTAKLGLNLLRRHDRTLDREARIERDERKRESKELDEKAARIKKEQKAHDLEQDLIREEIIDDHQEAA